MKSHVPDITQGGLRANGARWPNVFMAVLQPADEVMPAAAGLRPFDCDRQ